MGGGEGSVGGAGYHDDRLAVRNRHHSKIGFGADKPRHCAVKMMRL